MYFPYSNFNYGDEMRYTEKKPAEDDSTVIGTIISIIASPFRLVREIGVKFPFLPRSLIERVFLVAIGIATALTVATGVIKGSAFDLFTGKMPMVLQLLGILILVVLYIAYEVADFAIYKHVSKLLPSTNPKKKANPKPVQKEEDDALDLTKLDEDDAAEHNSEEYNVDDDTDDKEVSLDLSLLEGLGIEPDETTSESASANEPSTSTELNLDLSLLSDVQVEDLQLTPIEEDGSITQEATPEELKELASQPIITFEKPKLMSEDQSKIEDAKSIDSTTTNVKDNMQPTPDLIGTKDVLNFQNSLDDNIEILIANGLEYEGNLDEESVKAIETAMFNDDADENEQIGEATIDLFEKFGTLDKNLTLSTFEATDIPNFFNLAP